MERLSKLHHISTISTLVAPQRVKLLDGMLTLYTRPSTKIWWTEFYHKRKHIRTSTKTADLEQAKQVARQWFFEKQNEIAKGLAPSPRAKSFRESSGKAIAQYEQDAKQGKRSAKYVTLLKVLLNRINETIGKVDIEAVDQKVWNVVKQELLKRQPLSDITLHHYKNAIMVVLRQASIRGELKSLPPFVHEPSGINRETSRTWFQANEYKILVQALRANIAKHKKQKTRYVESAEELRDYALFVANTGMRTGEAMNVRFCDVVIAKEKNGNKQLQYLEIRSILGKRGRDGVCKSFYGAFNAFKRCVERHGLTLQNYVKSEVPIFKGYHRDMFREVLKSVHLEKTQDRPPRKRVMASLRNTYICFRLLYGVPIYDVAANCRTSVEMIQNHYAKHLNVFLSKTINRNDYNLAADG